MKKFVAFEGLGLTDRYTDEIIITAYGPRSGTRSTESLTPANAKILIEHLQCALKDFNLNRKHK